MMPKKSMSVQEMEPVAQTVTVLPPRGNLGARGETYVMGRYVQYYDLQDWMGLDRIRYYSQMGKLGLTKPVVLPYRRVVDMYTYGMTGGRGLSERQMIGVFGRSLRARSVVQPAEATIMNVTVGGKKR